MANVEKSVLVPYSASQMFQLVEDVERYPEFLPWCGGTHVEFRDERITRASIDIDYHSLKQSFTTENTRLPPRLIEIRLVNGPFRHLDGSWRFTGLDEEACKIDFRLYYEFSNRLIEKLVGPVFNYIANTLVDAFIRRAEKVYGS